MVYKWYILPLGGLYITYHLLREPGNSLDQMACVTMQHHHPGLVLSSNEITQADHELITPWRLPASPFWSTKCLHFCFFFGGMVVSKYDMFYVQPLKWGRWTHFWTHIWKTKKVFFSTTSHVLWHVRWLRCFRPAHYHVLKSFKRWAAS